MNGDLRELNGTNAKCRLHRAMSEFGVQSGKHVLIVSSSDFGPEADFVAGVLKTAMSPLFRLPAVSFTKLRGRDEGAEAGVHRFVVPLA